MRAASIRCPTRRIGKEGEGPDRLVVRWTQTNGCRGLGIATRAAAKKVTG